MADPEIPPTGGETLSGRLAGIDRRRVRAFLQGLTEPCFESVLWGEAFPEVELLRLPPLELYQWHFVLFHLLYGLQEEFHGEGLYLHVHFMRVFLLPWPGPGFCRHYEDERGRFCSAATPTSAEALCPFHRERVGDGALEELSLRTFYLDPANYQALDGNTIEGFLRGTWSLLGQTDRLKESFAALDLPQTGDLALVRRRFRELAHECHPDRGAPNHDKFVRVNRAYRFLMDVMPRLPVRR